MPLLFKEDTEQLIGSLITVHNQVGPGLDELLYQEACEKQFTAANINYDPQVSKWIGHRGANIKELVHPSIGNSGN